MSDPPLYTWCLAECPAHSKQHVDEYVCSVSVQKIVLVTTRERGGINQEFWINRYILLYIKWKSTRTYCIPQETILVIL